MLTVYFNKIAIHFTSKNSSSNDKTIHVANATDIIRIVKKINNNTVNSDIFLHGYELNTMYNDFCKGYKYIEAAGGVVINNKSEYLLIKRFDIWDLPKGKVKKNETTHKAATREVCEETGLRQIDILNTLPNTYHIYEQKNHWYLKKTYWYLMETNDDIKLTPQLDEAITEAVWMEKDDANTSLSKSYRSLYDTLGYLFK